MRDLIDPIQSWLEDGQAVALATVIKTWGSSPRRVGAGMAISADGQIVGSVSGGCVEGAVVDAALEVIKTGDPCRLHFGVADAEAWEVGLSCGGEIDIFLRTLSLEDLDIWKRTLAAEDQSTIVLVLDGDASLIGHEIPVNPSERMNGYQLDDSTLEILESAALEVLRERNSKIITINSSRIAEVFIFNLERTPDLILVGGAHIAVPLAAQAKTLGFQVTVIDPRRLFGTKDRFPDVERVLTEWPEKAFQKIRINDSTAVVMLTHDPKIDDPALKIALSSPAFYVGALGSRKTHQKRISRLSEQGISPTSLKRIHAPVGLDIGAVTPEEIALSILAELVQSWRKGTEIDD